jgi:hypothetical protein
MTNAITEHLTGLATEIDRHHSEALRAGAVALQHALNCGAALEQAQQCCASGWEHWLADHTTVSLRTAQVYLRLHRHRDRLPNDDTLSIKKAIGYLSTERRRPSAPLPDRLTLANYQKRAEFVYEFPNQLWAHVVVLSELGWSVRRLAEHFGTTQDVVARALRPEVPRRDMTGAEEWAGHYLMEIDHVLLHWQSTAALHAAAMAEEAGFKKEAASLRASHKAKLAQWLATRGSWESLTGPQFVAASTDARIAMGIEDEKDWPGSLVDLERRFTRKNVA